MSLSITNHGQITRFTSYDDVLPLLDNQELSSRVNGLTKTFYSVNVTQVMTSLMKVGDLLKVAYAASKTYPCNQHILSIMGTYQTIIGDTFQASGLFGNCAVQALNKHVLALKALESKKVLLAIKQMSRCAELAQSMEKIAGQLADAVGELAEKSLKAMEMASNDQSISADKQREIKQMIIDYKSEEAKQKSLAEDLAEATQKAREHEQKMMSKADQARKDKMTVAIVQACLGAVSNIATTAASAYSGRSLGTDTKPNEETSAKDTGLPQIIEKYQKEKDAKMKELQEVELELAKKEVELGQLDSEKDKEKINVCKQDIAALTLKVKQEEASSIVSNIQPLQDTISSEAATLEELEAKATEIRHKLEAEERNAKSKLKEAAEKLKGLSVESDELATAIQSLDVSIQTMGKVKTVFENVKLYWQGVAANCNAMTGYVSELEDLNEMEDLDGIKATIQDSGINWITLCKINYTAQASMDLVKGKVDSIVSNLPSLEEAKNIIKEFSPTDLIEDVV